MLKYFYLGFSILFLWAGLLWVKTPVPDVHGEIFEEQGVLSCAVGSKSNPMHIMKWRQYTTGFTAPYGIVGVCGLGNIEVGKNVELKWVHVPTMNVGYIISVRDLQTNQLYVAESVQRTKIAAFADDFKIYKVIFFGFFLIFLCMSICEWRKK
ncbi:MULTISPECIES: hypothetical protein [Deefgea]|uniref:Uncharacterized protein n=1 Tax=Deefgea chitinilytica TaxID=570276 RepID=A0ABS2CB20_9NEIS|nr:MULTISPECIES: hypothetical protein [Deefgea]MBM5570653.1 hypothetical protein [Deefgea chitinilytica]MBM9887882.1 hypothetical protein [Deefgea sp. CFH1-16]